ncbi:unnamed protein product [Meloidogyne enterolobii]|uniref:Uncharacterized protein n=1 Tax=Meloidogyne enterolobii TaxID=390850 RepID=A0ACB0ZED2_MELEN
MLCLPTETILDVFKFLSYNQLCSIKQTNFYLHDFVNYFEEELAREKLYEISIEDFEQYKQHPLTEAENLYFSLNDGQLEEMWKNGIGNPIALYLPNQDSNKNLVIRLTKLFDSEYVLLLQLPTIIKSKEDIKIVYNYLNKLFNCSFERGNFKEFLFNPELIKLLFGNAKALKRIYIKKCLMSITNHNIENFFQFSLDHLECKTLRSYFQIHEDIMEKYKDILFKTLIKGDNFGKIKLDFHSPSSRYDQFRIGKLLSDYIVEYVARVKHCSKVVNNIIVEY